MPMTRRNALTLGAAGLLALPAIRSARAAEATAEAASFLFPASAFLPAFVPHHLAQKRGYFTAEGLSVTFQTGHGGVDTAKQVAVGNVDLGGGVGETPMMVRGNGLPVKGVALLGGQPLFRIAARKAAHVTDIASLRGRKVGVVGYQDTSYYALLAVLAAKGMRRSDLEIQSVGPAGVTQLMIAGSLDAIMAVPDWEVAIENADVPLDTFAIDAVFPAMAQSVLASDTTIRQRPQAVGGFVRALMRAVRDCMDDPAAAARDFTLAVPQQAGKEADVERIVRLYNADVYLTRPASALGRFDPQQLAAVQRFYVDNAIIQAAVPIDDLYTNQFIA